MNTEETDQQPRDDMTVPLKGTMTIEARVYRAETGEWEDLGVIAEGEAE